MPLLAAFIPSKTASLPARPGAVLRNRHRGVNKAKGALKLAPDASYGLSRVDATGDPAPLPATQEGRAGAFKR